jgi:hypothetical protein
MKVHRTPSELCQSQEQWKTYWLVFLHSTQADLMFYQALQNSPQYVDLEELMKERWRRSSQTNQHALQPSLDDEPIGRG